MAIYFKFQHMQQPWCILVFNENNILTKYVVYAPPPHTLSIGLLLKTPFAPHPLRNPAMAAGISSSTSPGAILHLKHSPFLGPRPASLVTFTRTHNLQRVYWRPNLTACFVLEDEKVISIEESEEESNEVGRAISLAESVAEKVAEKMARKKSERFTYLVAAVMSSFGITSMAVMAVYYRFAWHMEGGEVPYAEMFGTFALSVGAAVGMEFWARWAHKALWHASLWHMHESHHKPREGPFELNDVFAIVNAVPAIALLSYGFFHKGLIPGLLFGAGLGITVFGIAYMFVHDGLVHRRFPVGPIANVPYFRRVASAHQLHHSEKFDGVPYGLFLGPKELEEVGGLEELEKEISRRIRLSKNL